MGFFDSSEQARVGKRVCKRGVVPSINWGRKESLTGLRMAARQQEQQYGRDRVGVGPQQRASKWSTDGAPASSSAGIGKHLAAAQRAAARRHRGDRVGLGLHEPVLLAPILLEVAVGRGVAVGWRGRRLRSSGGRALAGERDASQDLSLVDNAGCRLKRAS